MTNQKHINNLVKQYAEGSISNEAYIELMNYLKSAQDNEYIQSAMDEIWKNTNEDTEYSQDEANAFYSKLVADERFRKVPAFILWRRIAAAAVILIVLSTFAIIRNLVQNPKYNGVMMSLWKGDDVAPGRNRATLTLTNGKVITLSEEKAGVVIDVDKLTYNDGSKVRVFSQTESLTSAQALLTASTPRGGTYQVILPDGTHIWINAASTLKFPAKFTGNERKVELSGEAYFEVAKDSAHPFIVETDQQRLEVLGTHFNINSYADEPDTRTTLLEGSIKIALKQEHNKSVVMHPGQQAILDKTFDIRLQEVQDLEDAVSWKNTLAFNNEDLRSVMRKVSRWYNVDVEYRGKIKPSVMFSGRITKDRNLSSVIEMLELTDKVHFKIEGRKLIVMN